MKKEFPRYVRLSILASILMSGLVLLLYSFMGTYIRMITDDYCSAAIGLTYGSIAGVNHTYNTWASTYSNFFLKYSFAPLQPNIHAWITGFTIVSWIAALYYLFYQLSSCLGKIISRTAFIALILLFLFTMYRIMPSDQHIFWFGAVIPYVWPFLLASILFGSFIQYFRQERALFTFILMGIYTALMVLIIGGFIEIFITFMISIFGLSLLASPLVVAARRREFIILLLVALFAALIAIAIALSSPGIQIRQVVDFGNIEKITIPELAFNSVLYSVLFLFGEPFGIAFGQSFALAYLSSFFVTFLLGGLFYLQTKPTLKLPAPQNLRLTALIIGAIGFILVLSTMVTSYYAARVIPIRPLILPRFIQLSVIFCWAYLTLAAFQRYHILNRLQRTRTWPVLLVVFCVMMIWTPSFSLIKYGRLLPQFQSYADSWDVRHENLSNASSADEVIYIEPLDFQMELYLQLAPLRGLESEWNQCAADFYGLEGIIVGTKPSEE